MKTKMTFDQFAAAAFRAGQVEARKAARRLKMIGYTQAWRRMREPSRIGFKKLVQWVLKNQPVGREITSFDRNHNFEPGNNYKLLKVAKSCRLGRPNKSRSGPRIGPSKAKQTVHRTANIRLINKHKAR